MVFLKRWKRAKTQIKKLIKLGLDVDSAKCIGYSRIGYWRLAKTHEINKAMSNARLERNVFLFFLPRADAAIPWCCDLAATEK